MIRCCWRGGGCEEGGRGVAWVAWGGCRCRSEIRGLAAMKPGVIGAMDRIFAEEIARLTRRLAGIDGAQTGSIRCRGGPVPSARRSGAEAGQGRTGGARGLARRGSRHERKFQGCLSARSARDSALASSLINLQFHCAR